MVSPPIPQRRELSRSLTLRIEITEGNGNLSRLIPRMGTMHAVAHERL